MGREVRAAGFGNESNFLDCHDVELKRSSESLTLQGNCVSVRAAALPLDSNASSCTRSSGRKLPVCLHAPALYREPHSCLQSCHDRLVVALAAM
jgi:hypothetical protein